MESILEVLSRLLVITPRLVDKLEILSDPSPFDSQLFLFEAVGYLISIPDIPNSRQEGLLTVTSRLNLDNHVTPSPKTGNDYAAGTSGFIYNF